MTAPTPQHPGQPEGLVFPVDSCRSCGRVFPCDRLDAKPERGDDPETADWSRLECRRCYGPGFLPL